MNNKYYKNFAIELQKLPADQRLKLVKEYLSDIKDPEKRQSAARYLIAFQSGDDDLPETVFVLIHGIRTAGAWQDKLAQILEIEHQVTAIPVKYGILNLASFIFPPFRKKAIQRIERHLRDICELYPTSKIVVVAHSFGTFIISRLLADGRCIVDRVLLCGSVVPQDFDWKSAFPQANRKNIVNDIGTCDNWPVVAHAVSYGCGASGRFGFGNPCVVDRYHPIAHSEFFTDEHFINYWLPFFLEGRVVPSKHTEQYYEKNGVSHFFCSLPNCILAPAFWLSILIIALLVFI